MDLKEHMGHLCMDASELANAVGGTVRAALIERAMKGLPIPAEDARQICRYLGKRFGHSQIASDPPYEIDGMKTVGKVGS